MLTSINYHAPCLCCTLQLRCLCVFLWLCVWVCGCVCMCRCTGTHAYMCANMRRLDFDIRYPSFIAFHLYIFWDRVSLSVPKAHQFREADWLSKELQGPTCRLHYPPPRLGLQAPVSLPSLFMGAVNPKWGPHASTVGILWTAPSVIFPNWLGFKRKQTALRVIVIVGKVENHY